LIFPKKMIYESNDVDGYKDGVMKAMIDFE
jgi:hypothetical protein